MSKPASEGKLPQDIIAIFHASFHPTQGNVVDWNLKASNDIDLDGVEFSVLPSGLHLVERDTLYFSHQDYTGLALFRRRPTQSHGHRGFRLSSIGILLAKSARPRPWAHLASLRLVADAVYKSAETRAERAESLVDLEATDAETDGGGTAQGDELIEKDWEPARVWFEDRRVCPDAPKDGEVWNGWSDELDGVYASPHTPTPHLPHLLRILGLSSLTLYKFALTRRRILIYTLPPVEVACNLAWIAADLCREHHMSSGSHTSGILIEGLYGESIRRKPDVSRESLSVLGMITLNDIGRLESESEKGRGWIACTTDAIFLERPQYYDLIIDLTTSTPSKASRPTLYMSKPNPPSPNGKRKASWRLESIRFTWSDVKLWNELNRILKLDASHGAHPSHDRPASIPADVRSQSPASASPRWTEIFQLYEDVCLICASLWMGTNTWHANSRASFSTANDGTQWGSIKLEGDDDWSLGGTHMRNLGKGIEGRPDTDGAKIRTVGQGIEGRPTAASSVVRSAPKPTKRLSSASLAKDGQDRVELVEEVEEESEFRSRNIRTTLALLQTFHAHTAFLLSQLHSILPPPSASSTPVTVVREAARNMTGRASAEDIDVVTLSPRDLMSLELGIWSELDARFVEWLAEAEGYSGPGTGRTVVIRRGWKDLLGAVFGFG
ncbi:hypothetical protein BD410DRAFT_820784 [Rickenella mellea]|uniref:DUF4484 domain-containing protein n=1 Tax=Rickenella mellea TaxID=50990 RepID=A0A4Y7Q8I8_9AGAM|nr:hypothetical protein BD410DRAFT_820784 [Rickenella mellea]